MGDLEKLKPENLNIKGQVFFQIPRPTNKNSVIKKQSALSLLPTANGRN